MALDANKTVVREFLAAFSAGDIDAVVAMMTEDGTWWVSGSLAGFSGTHEREPFGELLRSVKPAYKSGALVITPKEMTAEGNRVSVEADGFAEFQDGRVYNPSYHFMFELADGRIRRVREYMDTLHAKMIFFPD